MAHPLELSYSWRTPVTVSGVGLAVCLGILVDSRAYGWGAVAMVLVLMWLLFLGVVWLRTRAYMMVDGPMLTVRRFRTFHTIDGRRVTAVSEFLTPNGPSYRVSTPTDAGQTERHIVPAALLRRGHSTLFDWVLTWAPGSSLDKGCRRTVDQLRTRGLIE